MNSDVTVNVTCHSNCFKWCPRIFTCCTSDSLREEQIQQEISERLERERKLSEMEDERCRQILPMDRRIEVAFQKIVGDPKQPASHLRHVSSTSDNTEVDSPKAPSSTPDHSPVISPRDHKNRPIVPTNPNQVPADPRPRKYRKKKKESI